MKKNEALAVIEKLDDDQIDTLVELNTAGTKGIPKNEIAERAGINTRKLGGFKRRGWAEEHSTRKGTVVRLTPTGRKLARHAA